ncbi:vWA domain-containing protein [Luteibacter aegosomatissinici]|uniref:vWA domain-containing protein n=1 Tax=Luteibacter aegosomatissinici TaxID=2911539 RepID=UPI001FF83228|nr:RNA-binding protein [Luteibacter aegosomatissinici]UPG94509.1 RNA-binding protein [Luteibacter aegosomatissinici]
MANRTLFTSARGAPAPQADAINEAGGTAYLRDPRSALALYAATGCLNGTYYATEEAQLAQALALCAAVPADFVARVAIHARQKAHMKDMPALLLAHLANRDGAVLEKAFNRVIDNGRMLRNFVQIMRSGVTGRRSLGSRPKRLVQQWLEQASTMSVLAASVGTQPSLADVIRMVHPRPADAGREALYAWLLGRPHAPAVLPSEVLAYELFKADPRGTPPETPREFFASLPLTTAQRKAVALRGSWQSIRMNLNTFARQGLFEDEAFTQAIAARLRDREAIRKARVFPYQLMVAYRAAEGTMPQAIANALHDAMEAATAAVPALKGQVVIAVDVSGSMANPVTGYRRGATTVATCVEVAALIAATLKRANPRIRIIPFNQAVVPYRERKGGTVMAKARELAALVSGGTAVSAPLRQLAAEKAKVDMLLIVSDNQSWFDVNKGQDGTASMQAWNALKARNPSARLACIDVQPYATSQFQGEGRDDVLHIAGFSDAVFGLLADAARGKGATHWVERIEATPL